MDDAAFNAFISDFKQFQGQMLEFKSTTERRLYDNGLKLTQIERDMQTPKTCQSHEALIKMIDSMKNDESKQEMTNQKVEVKQVAQDKGITDLEKKTDKQEFQLKAFEKMQLNVASVGTVVLFIIQVADWLAKNYHP